MGWTSGSDNVGLWALLYESTLSMMLKLKVGHVGYKFLHYGRLSNMLSLSLIKAYCDLPVKSLKS